ncbi:MAG: FxLYD domain-containing protein [Euryarchaeota archaeon]|nr:FxLYD domain-containing protein [Euryarchaeota archaeon]
MRSNETSLDFCKRFVLCLAISATLLISIGCAGCLSRQSQPTTITSDQLEIRNKYFFNYNGTSFLTGIVVNKATVGLVNVNLQAEGYANDTVYERGHAGPDTGIKSMIPPNESSPFMIKMVPVASQSNNTIPSANLQGNVNVTKTSGTTGRVASQTSNQTIQTSAQKPQLSYRIEPQIKSLSSTQPYPLSAINTKAAAFNQAINVSGEIYNEGNENVSSSIVAAVFYQENGTVLGVFTGSPQGDLGPKKTAPFQIDVQTSAFPIKPAKTEIYAYQLVD